MDSNVSNSDIAAALSSVELLCPPPPASEEPVEEAAQEFEKTWVEDAVNVLRATRGWIQYGVVGFAILCVVVGAVEALFDR